MQWNVGSSRPGQTTMPTELQFYGLFGSHTFRPHLDVILLMDTSISTGGKFGHHGFLLSLIDETVFNCNLLLGFLVHFGYSKGLTFNKNSKTNSKQICYTSTNRTENWPLHWVSVSDYPGRDYLLHVNCERRNISGNPKKTKTLQTTTKHTGVIENPKSPSNF